MMKQFQWQQSDEMVTGFWSDVERAWLTHSGSLTQRLRTVTRGQIQHRVVQEDYASPAKEECLVLGMQRGANAHIREIDWWYLEKLWVAARVIIPEHTWDNGGRPLRTVGKRSLGDILFSNPNLQRSKLQFAQLNKDHPYFYRVSHHLSLDSDFIWARRSIFYFNRNPLLIIEMFAPEIFTISPSANA